MREVRRRTEEVALVRRRDTFGDPGPHVRKRFIRRERLDQTQRDLDAVGVRQRLEHHLVADHLHDTSAQSGDDLDGGGFET